MNTIVIFALGSILGFAAARLKSMRYFQKPDQLVQPGAQWVLVPEDKLPEVRYVIDEKSAFSSTVDRLFLSKES